MNNYGVLYVFRPLSGEEALDKDECKYPRTNGPTNIRNKGRLV